MRLSREEEKQESIDQQEEVMKFIEVGSQQPAQIAQNKKKESESEEEDEDNFEIDVQEFKKMNEMQKMFVCKYANFQCWRNLNFEGEFPNQFRDKNGQTLLHHCAIKGYLNKSKFLVENQFCDATTRDNLNFTAFDYSAVYGNKRVSDYLLKTGQCTPGHWDIALRINPIPNSQHEELIIATIYADNEELLKNYMDGYVTNLNGYFSELSCYGQTLLQVAVKNLSKACTKLLLDLGANVNYLGMISEQSAFDLALYEIQQVILPQDKFETIEIEYGLQILELLLNTGKVLIGKYSEAFNIIIQRFQVLMNNFIKYGQANERQNQMVQILSNK